jgi:hypothetical protein
LEALALKQYKNIQQILLLQAFYGTTFCKRYGMDLVAPSRNRREWRIRRFTRVTAY